MLEVRDSLHKWRSHATEAPLRASERSHSLTLVRFDAGRRGGGMVTPMGPFESVLRLAGA